MDMHPVPSPFTKSPPNKERQFKKRKSKSKGGARIDGHAQTSGFVKRIPRLKGETQRQVSLWDKKVLI
jgi:hypothetical protein